IGCSASIRVPTMSFGNLYSVFAHFILCSIDIDLHAPFYFQRTPPTEIYTLSLHDALPIFFSRSRRKTNKRKSKHSAMLRNKETRHRMFIGLLNTTRKLA